MSLSTTLKTIALIVTLKVWVCRVPNAQQLQRLQQLQGKKKRRTTPRSRLSRCQQACLVPCHQWPLSRASSATAKMGTWEVSKRDLSYIFGHFLMPLDKLSRKLLADEKLSSSKIISAASWSSINVDSPPFPLLPGVLKTIDYWPKQTFRSDCRISRVLL